MSVNISQIRDLGPQTLFFAQAQGLKPWSEVFYNAETTPLQHSLLDVCRSLEKIYITLPVSLGLHKKPNGGVRAGWSHLWWRTVHPEEKVNVTLRRDQKSECLIRVTFSRRERCLSPRGVDIKWAGIHTLYTQWFEFKLITGLHEMGGWRGGGLTRTS